VLKQTLPGIKVRNSPVADKKEDENCTSSFPSSTIPLTSGIEEAPQLLLSVLHFYHISILESKPPTKNSGVLI
jgi:hypothetical protein